jgi:dihydroorotase
MQHDLAIVNGTVVTSGGRFTANLGVQGGKIAVISTSALDAAETIDAAGLHVMAGVIDAHTHFRDPAYPEKEDFTSGTSAGAAGGVTTVLEMPAADVGTSNVERFHKRRAILAQKAVIDFGLYGASGQDNIPDIPGLAEAGAIAFKSILREPYPAREVNFFGMKVTDDGALYQVTRAVAATGRLWTFHAENEWIVEALEAALPRSEREDPMWFAHVRPDIVEEEATRKALLFARATGPRAHMVHITTASAVRAIAEAKAEGRAVSAEACIGHLMLTEESLRTQGILGRTTPRLRTAEDQAALWEGLRRGWVDTIASDHASYTIHDMDQGWDGRGAATAGYAGIEHMLPLVLTRALAGELTLEQVTRAMSENPARLFGLWPRKGAIQVGADADLVLVDTRRRWHIDQREMVSKAKLTPFDGWEATAAPVMTLVRGRVVMADGKITAQPGYGQFLTPEYPRDGIA